ncbi:MAG: Holliday junction branch migration protein RuvA [Ornithinimicrobium sp.]
MIASVRGSVAHVGLDHLVVEVGGIGLKVHTTPATAAGFRMGSAAHLHTSMVVREESLTLYGFADADAQVIFEQVQTVSGVGPRLAQAMLAVHEPDDVRRAITGGDLVALTKVPGIGRKGAERIVLELRDKVTAVVGSVPADALTTTVRGHTHPKAGEVIEALVGLGWSARQADDTVRSVTAKYEEASADGSNAPANEARAPMDVAALLRAALQDLGR